MMKMKRKRKVFETTACKLFGKGYRSRGTPWKRLPAQQVRWIWGGWMNWNPWYSVRGNPVYYLIKIIGIKAKLLTDTELPIKANCTFSSILLIWF